MVGCMGTDHLIFNQVTSGMRSAGRHFDTGFIHHVTMAFIIAVGQDLTTRHNVSVTRSSSVDAWSHIAFEMPPSEGSNDDGGRQM